MPQTMPMNWVSLFLLFTIIFLMLNLKMYFLNTMNPKSMNMNKSKTYNWKW